MRKVLVLLFIMALVAGLVAIAGCGDDKTTVKTPFGDVEVSEEDGEFNIEGDEGEITAEGTEEAPSEAELGVDVYPGADYVEGSGTNATITTPEGEMTTVAANYTTDDSFDDVVSFYEGELGSPLYVDTTSGEAYWTEDMGDGTVLQVNVVAEGGETSIIIARVSGGM